MPGRLPTKEDGIPGTYAIVPPPASQSATNILILLHGLGDTHSPFQSFGQRLQLPETACISIKGSARMPFDLEGAHWGDDIVFDEANGGIDIDTGFKKSTKVVLEDVIKKVLVEKCGYRLREILLFGFGQGGMLAMNVAAELGEEELGGVVSIGGALPATAPLAEVNKKSRTPVIVCKGYRNLAVTYEDEGRIKDTFTFAEIKEWSKTGDGMPSNRDEMLPIMQFFARRLRSTHGVPKGSVELT